MKQPANWDSVDPREYQTLAEAWLNYYRILERAGDLTGKTDVADSERWAIERLDEIARINPELCWRLILEILAQAESDFQRACLAAGPLEDLLNDHGADFIDRAETVAKNSEAFRELLTGVWRNTIREDIWGRVQIATQPPEQEINRGPITNKD